MKVFDVAACPLCGAADLDEFDLGGGNLLVRCSRCDAVSAPAYADPGEVYADGYMFGETDFGLDVRHPLFQEYLAHVARARLERVERHAGGRGSLLDVGSGTGELLAGARTRGWRVQGVEPERTAAAMARERGVEVAVAPLEDAGLAPRSWDVVSAFHVLEHIPDPIAFLRTLARWARPGGHVVVEVPNFDSRLRKRRGGAWSHLRPLEHINHFTPRTLEASLRGAGLEPVAIATPTWVTPPQTLEQALLDLGLDGRGRRALRPLSRPHQDGDAHVPGRLAWSLLRGVASVHERRGAGAVVLGVARSPEG